MSSHLAQGLLSLGEGSRGSLGQGIVHPLIDGLRALHRGLSDQPVVLWRCAKRQFSGKGFFRHSPVFGTPSKIVVHRAVERRFEFVDGCARKVDHIPDALDGAMKQAVVRVQPDRRRVSFIGRHGVTPASPGNRRRATMAPLSVSGLGCGRWKTARTPFTAILTREPAPSVIVAPWARRRVSISLHRMLERTGLSNIAARVRGALDAFICALSPYAIACGFSYPATQAAPQPDSTYLVSINDIVKGSDPCA